MKKIIIFFETFLYTYYSTMTNSYLVRAEKIRGTDRYYKYMQKSIDYCDKRLKIWARIERSSRQ